LKAAACLVAAIAIGGCASASRALDGSSISSATRAHGSLTDREFSVAVAVARAEVEKYAATVTSATATVGTGTVTDPNAGPACTSGTLLHIKLIGTFPTIVVGGPSTGAPGASNDYTVSAVLITADPETGKACDISVETGPQAPDPGATLLFTQSPSPAVTSPASTTPSTAASAAAPAALDRTFHEQGGSFEYPSAWAPSEFPDDVGSFSRLLTVLSNQPVHDPCVTSGNSITCDQPLNVLDSGGVLIQWSEQSRLGNVFASPSGSPTTIDSNRSIITTNPTTDPQCAGIAGTAYELDAYIPQSPGNGWTMTACLAAPVTLQTLATVTAMLHSLRFDS
jgi:hypothetical protein